MKSSSTSSSISLTKSKPKVTAGTVVALPTPTPTIGNRTRSRRSSSVFSVDTNKADFLPLSDTRESCSRSRYDLYFSHPSLARTIKPLRHLRGTSDVSCARALAQVLLSGITDVVHLMQAPQEIRNDVEYLENTQAVSFMIQQLRKEVERLVSFRELQETHAVIRIIDVAELTLAALSRLLGLIERLVKPLPSIPADSDEEENSTEGSTDRSAARMSLAQITTEALKLPSSSHRPSSAPASDNASLKTNSTSRTATILTILHKARENGLGSLFRHKHETIENEVTQEDTSPHYSPRQSALYYPVDPLHPDVDIELPPMSQDAMNIVLSHDNTQMIKSSPTAIVRLLTSKDAIQDPNLIHWFFTSFRYVLLPSEVLHLLICRFDEPMPDVQMTRRQMRVWYNNQHKIVRPRVVSLLIRWITQYWEPPYDDICVLNDMQDFVLKQVSASLLPDSLGITFAQAIKGVRVDGAARATWLQNRLKGKLSNRTISASFAFNGDDTIRFPLDAFDCPAGYNALAEQLTRLEVELYGQLPSHALIRTWLKGKTEACEERLTGTLSEMRVRHEAIGVKLTKLLQQAEGSSNRTLIETLRFQQMDLLKESSRLAMKIHAYEVIEKEIESSKQVATQAATAARDFDRSLNMLVLHTIIMDSKDKDSIIRAVKFWFNVAVVSCFHSFIGNFLRNALRCVLN
jgi:hypothetical protein